MTFKKAEELRDIAKDVPLERILVETDSPYLAPVPNRGKTNEPSYVVHTARTSRGANARHHTHRSHRHRGHVHRHGHCRFVEGHYAIRRVRVVLPGHYVERVIPARYEVRWNRHRFVKVEVASRRVVREWIPERVEVRRKRVWVRGRWVCS